MKICILAAGRGTRMGNWGETLHKAILPLGNLGIISRIIAQFSDRHQYVIAVGFRQDQIKEYIQIVHPKLKVTFVEVKNFEGPGSGPGLSLYSCRKHLQTPFIFTACDTLITSKLPACKENWIGVKKVNDIEKWCSAKIDAHKNVTEIFYKEKADTVWAFAGIGYVKNVKDFWKGFEDNRKLLSGELQVNNGLEGLTAPGLKAYPVEWIDTGNEENYKKALRKFEKNYSFEGKSVDFTYRRTNDVIKFYHDPQVSRRRYLRAKKYPGIFSDVRDLKGHFYSYRFQDGTLLSAVNNAQETEKFLEWVQSKLWKTVSVQKMQFAQVCRDFYRKKSLERLKSFSQKYLSEGEEKDIVINGLKCLTVEELIKKLPDSFDSQGLASQYHGDLHDDNIIKRNGGYTLIDWRDSFGGLMEAGDRYYDLAKYLHTLEFSVEAMAKKRFTFIKKGNKVQAANDVPGRAKDAQQAFWKFCHKYNYDRNRIEIIDGLIFINMACFYEKDLALYLYTLGRFKLQQVLDENRTN